MPCRPLFCLFFLATLLLPAYGGKAKPMAQNKAQAPTQAPNEPQRELEDQLLESLLFAITPYFANRIVKKCTPAEARSFRRLEKHYFKPGKAIPVRVLQRIRERFHLPYTQDPRVLLRALQNLIAEKHQAFLYEEKYAISPLASKEYVTLSTETTLLRWLETKAPKSPKKKWRVTTALRARTYQSKKSASILLSDALKQAGFAGLTPVQEEELISYLNLRNQGKLTYQNHIALLTQVGIHPSLYDFFTKKNCIFYDRTTRHVKIQMRNEYREKGISIPVQNNLCIFPQHRMGRYQKIINPLRFAYEDEYQQQKVEVRIKKFIQYYPKHKIWVSYFQRGKTFYKKVAGRDKKSISGFQFHRESQKKATQLLVGQSRFKTFEEDEENEEKNLYKPRRRRRRIRYGKPLRSLLGIFFVGGYLYFGYKWYTGDMMMNGKELQYRNSGLKNHFDTLKMAYDKLLEKSKPLLSKTFLNGGGFASPAHIEKMTNNEEIKLEEIDTPGYGFLNLGDTCYFNAFMTANADRLEEIVAKEDTMKPYEDKLNRMIQALKKLPQKEMNALKSLENILKKKNNATQSVLSNKPTLWKMINHSKSVLTTTQKNDIESIIGLLIKPKIKRCLAHINGKKKLPDYGRKINREIINLVNITVPKEKQRRTNEYKDRFVIHTQHDSQEMGNKLFDLLGATPTAISGGHTYLIKDTAQLLNAENQIQASETITYETRSDPNHSFSLEIKEKDRMVTKHKQSEVLKAETDHMLDVDSIIKLRQKFVKKDNEVKFDVHRLLGDKRFAITNKGLSEVENELLPYEKLKKEEEKAKKERKMESYKKLKQEREEKIPNLVAALKKHILSADEKTITKMVQDGRVKLSSNHLHLDVTGHVEEKGMYWHDDSSTDFLSIQLKIFSFDGSGSKNQRFVIPNKRIYVKSRKDDKKNTYELCSCVVHSGATMGAGHYYALVKKAGKFFEYNDNWPVKKIGDGSYEDLAKYLEQIGRQRIRDWGWGYSSKSSTGNAYLLLYKKVKDDVKPEREGNESDTKEDE